MICKETGKSDPQRKKSILNTPESWRQYTKNSKQKIKKFYIQTTDRNDKKEKA